MSDLSTREQIHREAIERIARAEYEYEASVDFHPSWEKLPPEVRDRYRYPARRAVDALGDLLPTGAEWGYGGAFEPPIIDNLSEDEARASSKTIWRRYEHDWIEVPE